MASPGQNSNLTPIKGKKRDAINSPGVRGYDAMPPAQQDPLRNPHGLYSGMAKRSAIQDGSFTYVEGASESTRKRGKS